MENFDLKAYFKRVLDNWLIILLCCIIGASGAFAYSAFVATPMYSSKVTISVNNTDWTSGVNINDIQTTLKLVESCVLVLEHDEMIEKVATRLEEQTGEEFTAKEIKAAISYSQMGESNFIEVVSKTDDPELSALVCNIVAAEAPDMIVRNVAGIGVSILEEDGAKVNPVPVSPNVVKNVALGLIVSFAVSCFVILIIMYFDNTIPDGEVVKEKYGLSVLGTIPNFESAARKRRDGYSTYQ